ncbi:hypothetical protein [Nocardia vulneris]|uniref:Uncharacterized protein n=1 Tax=Nocardia vulneris TaxID=1141657 RepID=A0ABR4Z4X3_9NOCA|nr:hypothetical protein [Nocardia vulneris]KIA60380.1 hypothetical protein FG87_37190 [Nocardia vulneris]
MKTPEQRPGDVLYVVMAAIDDGDDLGSFTTAELLRVVRRDLDPTPTAEEVTTALTLLALPSINGLHVAGDEWQPADPVDRVASRLYALAEAVADYRHGFNGLLELDNRY